MGRLSSFVPELSIIFGVKFSGVKFYSWAKQFATSLVVLSSLFGQSLKRVGSLFETTYLFKRTEIQN